MNKISQAAALGRKAFLAGLKCVPALDKDFMELLGRAEVGKSLGLYRSIPLLKAWIRAWNTANLSA